MPLRPIVSFVGSPTYNLSKHLAFLLSPLVGKSPYSIRNTAEWVERASSFTLEPDEELVSFDVQVVSLFTSIPTDVAVRVAYDRLCKDDGLVNRTALTPDQVRDMLLFCLNAIEFRFRDVFYKQIHGTAIGSPVSVVVANLVMEDLEDRALRTFLHTPRLYYRFVDDTIAALKSNLINDFHAHLNAQDSSIQFTVERYSQDGLPFLDTLNVVSINGSIETSVYRKKTHTDRYLDFDSHHPICHKRGVVRALQSRADMVSSTERTKELEHQRIVSTLKENGYPTKLIKSTKRQKMRVDSELDSSFRGSVCLPYIEGTTERLRRILFKYGIKVFVKPYRIIAQSLNSAKDRVEDDKTGIVYSIPCATCDTVYIGETGRALSTRKKEHMASVRLEKTDTSAG